MPREVATPRSFSARYAALGRALIGQLLLAIAVIVAIDMVAYFALPNSVAWKFYDYRKGRDYVGGKRGYPKGYFAKHPERGFDIATGARGIHELPEISYPVWSNALGCFDREWPTVPAKYVYFAGDSFTWGYAPFEQKFATQFEALSGRPSLKCGVTSAGTRHEFHKFKEIAATVGHYPERVIVSLFSNDIADDYVFPLATVLDGVLVNSAYMGPSGEIVEVDEEWIREQLAARLSQPPEQETCALSLWMLAKCYSATANVLNELRRVLSSREATEAAPQRALTYKGVPIVQTGVIERDYVRDGRILYGAKTAQPNRDVIRAWRDHAKTNGYHLSFVLIPPPYVVQGKDYYAEVKAYLAGLGIEVLDLQEEFRRLGADRSAVYWRYDGHFSPAGDRILANALVRRWGRAP